MPSTTPAQAIATRLLASSGVTALVGQRVTPGKPDQDSQGDYLVYSKASGGGGGHRLDGVPGMRWYLIRVTAYATTAEAAEAIITATRTALDGWGDESEGVVRCFAQPDQDEIVLPDEGGGVYQVSGQTFGFWYRG